MDPKDWERLAMNRTLVGTFALRCPRPRSSGRHGCAAGRGADGAARHPYLCGGAVEGYETVKAHGSVIRQQEETEGLLETADKRG